MSGEIFAQRIPAVKTEEMCWFVFLSCVRAANGTSNLRNCTKTINCTYHWTLNGRSFLRGRSRLLVTA